MTPTQTIPLLVFSDLDGTLLDHDTYSFEPAVGTLARLSKIGAGVVIATSKTAAEVAPLRLEMGLEHWPAIVENGAGVLPPGSELPPLGDAYPALRAALDGLPESLRSRFTGFGDMSAQEVCGATGLPLEQAQLAKRRAFSEPGIFRGDRDLRRDFTAALAQAGISARDGGRFLTLSFGATKASRMEEIIRGLRPLHTAALGDAPNDIEMLERAETGILIPNPHAPALPPLKGETEGTIVRAPCPGPAGWAVAMTALLASLDLP